MAACRNRAAGLASMVHLATHRLPGFGSSELAMVGQCLPQSVLLSLFVEFFELIGKRRLRGFGCEAVFVGRQLSVGKNGPKFRAWPLREEQS